MFSFIGYNFYGDEDCLNSGPGFANPLTSIVLKNAIFDHLNVTKNIDLEYNATIPTLWDYDTIINADLNGDLQAGNVDFVVGEISEVRIKRRITGTFNWITLFSIPPDKMDELSFIYNDRLNASGVTYDYAFVPVFGDVEGPYIINSIYSEFNGVFIGDRDTIYKFLYDVSYSSNARNQQTGRFEPLGKKYPVIISNGLLSFNSGSVEGLIVNDEFAKDGKVDRYKTRAKKEIIKEYLTNHKAKILKDWNGNIWLVMITDNVGVEYQQGSSMSLPKVSFNWTEIGDSNSQADLYHSGILEEVE